MMLVYIYSELETFHKQHAWLQFYHQSIIAYYTHHPRLFMDGGYGHIWAAKYIQISINIQRVGNKIATFFTQNPTE